MKGRFVNRPFFALNCNFPLPRKRYVFSSCVVGAIHELTDVLTSATSSRVFYINLQFCYRGGPTFSARAENESTASCVRLLFRDKSTKKNETIPFVYLPDGSRTSTMKPEFFIYYRAKKAVHYGQPLDYDYMLSKIIDGSARTTPMY